MAVACLRGAAGHTMHTSEHTNDWYAVRVRARQEELVAAALTHKGYEVLLPQYTCRKRWSDRVKESRQPLFPGYLFSRFDIGARFPLLVTPGVMQIVGLGRTFVPVDAGEIAAIEQIVASGLPAEPAEYLRVGQRVRIEGGPLRGVEGILTRVNERRRLVVSVTLLQRAVLVEVDPSEVLPADEPVHVLGFHAWSPEVAAV